MTESIQRQRGVWICLGLAAAVALLYWPVHRFEFINFDDQVYVTDNGHVRSGLMLANVRWAFTTLEAQFWHPLTWLSHMLDCQIYGLKAGGHHVTNVLLHLANTLLLFGVLRRMSGAVWQSAWVAALFGLHPLHVESVAWVAERKDVLSTLFWLLTLWAYRRYAEFRCSSFRFQVGPTKWYGVTLGFFVLGLMAKPMLVTLPFVLLLLDYWPLRRLELSARNPSSSTFLPLVCEKVPFFVLTMAASLVAVLAQQGEGALAAAGQLAGERLANAVISYVRYLGKTIWPADLAVIYPWQFWSPWLVAGAALLLAGITFAAFKLGRRRPYLAVGWFWYLGTMVPVTGLVQIGPHAMADRYTYVPLIGIFLMVVWGAGDLLTPWQHGRKALVLLAVGMLAGCLGCGWFQVGHWQNSITLFQHAVAATRNNSLAHYTLGNALLLRGRVPEAMAHYEAALRIKPGYIRAHNNLGNALFQLGRVPEAIAHWEQVLRLTSGNAVAHNNLGEALMQQGRVKEAAAHFEQAVRKEPGLADAYFNLGNALLRLGRVPEAVLQYEQVLRLKPDDAEAGQQLGRAQSKLMWTLATAADAAIRDGVRAVALAESANRTAGGKDPWVLDTLAAAYAETGRFDDAVRTAAAAVALANGVGQTEQARRIKERLELYQAGRPYREGGVRLP